MNENIIDQIAEFNPEAIIFDGYNEAIIGVTAMNGNRESVAIYDIDKVIEILMRDDGMTYQDAVEYFEYNILGGYYGEHTPILMYKLEDEV